MSRDRRYAALVTFDHRDSKPPHLVVICLWADGRRDARTLARAIAAQLNMGTVRSVAAGNGQLRHQGDSYNSSMLDAGVPFVMVDRDGQIVGPHRLVDGTHAGDDPKPPEVAQPEPAKPEPGPRPGPPPIPSAPRRPPQWDELPDLPLPPSPP